MSLLESQLHNNGEDSHYMLKSDFALAEESIHKAMDMEATRLQRLHILYSRRSPKRALSVDMSRFALLLAIRQLRMSMTLWQIFNAVEKAAFIGGFSYIKRRKSFWVNSFKHDPNVITSDKRDDGWYSVICCYHRYVAQSHPRYKEKVWFNSIDGTLELPEST